MLGTILLAIVIMFPVSEIALTVFKRASARVASRQDSGSKGFLWVVIVASFCLAAAFQWVSVAVIHASAPVLELTALGIMVIGMTVRWTAILTLGPLFTVEVAVQTDHRLVDSGIYRHIRHPSYAGLLLMFLGLGVLSANWLSLVALTVPTTAAIITRIGIEERVLREALGASYETYCARTRRLVPGVY